MIDDYLKKLETIISPQTYDLTNYKDKILQSSINFPDKNFIQGLDVSRVAAEREEKRVAMQQQPVIQKDNLNDYQSQMSLNKSNNEKTNIEIEAEARGKVHQLNVKNMAYRQQIDALNRKVEEQARTIDSQRRTIEEYQVIIENNSRYLLKLESYLVEAGKNKARERFTLNLLGVSSEFAKECKDQAGKASFSVEKINLKELVVSLANENQKLKDFQTKVIELSKQYDEVNDQMVDSLKFLKDKFLSNSANFGSSDDVLMADLNNNLNQILFCVQETLNIKQSEYQMIIDTKDQELNFLRKEIVQLNESLENSKKDRMKDQKNMIEIECQNNQLHNEIEELQKTIHENYTKLKLLDSENISSKIEVHIFIVTIIRNESNLVRTRLRTFYLSLKKPLI